MQSVADSNLPVDDCARIAVTCGFKFVTRSAAERCASRVQLLPPLLPRLSRTIVLWLVRVNHPPRGSNRPEQGRKQHRVPAETQPKVARSAAVVFPCRFELGDRSARGSVE